MRLALTIGLASLALAACEGEDPVESALRDAASANHAAATRTTAEVEAATPAAGPGPSAEDRTWIEATIADHRLTISATEPLLLRTEDPGVRRAASALIATRQREIIELQALLAEPTPGR